MDTVWPEELRKIVAQIPLDLRQESMADEARQRLFVCRPAEALQERELVSIELAKAHDAQSTVIGNIDGFRRPSEQLLGNELELRVVQLANRIIVFIGCEGPALQLRFEPFANERCEKCRSPHRHGA